MPLQKTRTTPQSPGRSKEALPSLRGATARSADLSHTPIEKYGFRTSGNKLSAAKIEGRSRKTPRPWARGVRSGEIDACVHPCAEPTRAHSSQRAQTTSNKRSEERRIGKDRRARAT